MKVYVIQAEWSSGIPEEPEVHLDEMHAQASWDSAIEHWIDYRLAGTPDDAVLAERDRLTALLEQANPDGWGWGAGTAVLDDDTTLRSWEVEVEGRERAGKVGEPSGVLLPCVCVVTRESDGALCLCSYATATETQVCDHCTHGAHLFDATGRSTA